MSRSKLILYTLFLIGTAIATSQAHSQTAELDSTDILEGDIAILVIEYRTNVPSLFSLDTTPLQEDFEVLRVKASLQRQQTSNDIADVMHWEVELFPLRSGQITIPSINIKEHLTPTLTLDVKARETIQNNSEKIFLKTTTDHRTAYLGEQIIVTQQLLHNRRLRQIDLLDLKLERAEIFPLGDDNLYQQTIDGESISVLERRLAISAHVPGQLTLPAADFRGVLEDSKARRIRRLGSPLTIEIRPPPETYTGNHWLPASTLEISQQWSLPEDQLSVGDSISRQITMNARGLAAATLPEAVYQINDNFEVYPDQPQRVDQFDDKGIIGELRQTHAIVFTQAGETRIPDQIIEWWDTDENVRKSSLLPGKTLTVLAPVKPVKQSRSPELTNKRFWLWIPVSGLILVVTIIYLGRKLMRSFAVTKLRFDRRSFKRACFTGQPREAQEQLLIWATGKWPLKPVHGLLKLSSLCQSSSFKHQLRLLDETLYAPNHSDWQGRELWQGFVEEQKQATKTSTPESNHLPDLYQN